MYTANNPSLPLAMHFSATAVGGNIQERENNMMATKLVDIWTHFINNATVRKSECALLLGEKPCSYKITWEVKHQPEKTPEGTTQTLR